ncbi:MAG: hypothetical protein PF692_09530 [Kiritimatiellae bacterium]|jgi:hypothetical protein|nr:hypothetical protein [Kiritimatiellia bacterium]
MKQIIVNIIIWLFMTTCIFAQDDNQPYIRSSINIPERSVYVNEIWPFEFSITSYKVQLSPNLSISGLPVAPYLFCSDFFENPEKRVNKDYNVEITKTFQCNAYSSVPGDLALAPTIHMSILQKSRGFFRNWIETPYEQKVKPKRLRILPLPEDKNPATFSGAVGTFKIETKTKSKDVTINSLIKLNIVIQGSGYLKNIKAPIIGENENFKIYNPILLDKEENQVTFEQTIIPLSEKADTIPSVSFRFFDPSQAEYVTISSPEIKLTFHKEKSGNNQFEAFRPTLTVTNNITNLTVSSSTSQSVDPSFSEVIPQNTINIAMYAMSGVALFIIIISWMFFSKKRAILTTVTIIVLAGIIAFAIRKYTTTSEKYPLYVVSQQSKARIAPNSQALKTFQLNKGDYVFLKETYGDWSMIFKNEHYGWVKNETIGKQ